MGCFHSLFVEICPGALQAGTKRDVQFPHCGQQPGFAHLLVPALGMVVPVGTSRIERLPPPLARTSFSPAPGAIRRCLNP